MLWLIGTLVKGTDIEGHAIRKQSRRKSIVQPFMIFYSLGQHSSGQSSIIASAGYPLKAGQLGVGQVR